MFNAYEFTFAGKSQALYDLIICDIGGTTQDAVSFGNKASIVETRTVNRIKPIHYGVNYHEDPLEFKIVFGSEKELDRFDMEKIAFWLTGHQEYQWLNIHQPDLMHVQFRCLITELTPVFNGWLPVAFEATVLCDCPYAYGREFCHEIDVSGEQSVIFRNEGSVHEYLKPVVTVSLSQGATDFKIINHSDSGREFCFTGLPASGIEFVVRNESGVMEELTSTGVNLYQFFNMNFFRLVEGDNQLQIVGDGRLFISGRFLHNVAG